MEVIYPTISGFFDPQLHEVGSEYITQQQQQLDKNSKKKTMWVMRRGFRHKEDTVDGPPRVPGPNAAA